MLHFLNKWWRNTFIVRYFNIKKGVIFNILDCLVVETVVLLESSEISVVLKLLPRMPSTVWAKSKRKKTLRKQINSQQMHCGDEWWMNALGFATDTLACKRLQLIKLHATFSCLYITTFVNWISEFLDWLINVDWGFRALPKFYESNIVWLFYHTIKSFWCCADL